MPLFSLVRRVIKHHGVFVFTNYQQSRAISKLKMSSWATEKERILKLDLETRRKLYGTKKYYTMDEIPVWGEEHLRASKAPEAGDMEYLQTFSVDGSLNKALANKVSIWKGDITQLEIDAIVNAANSRLAGGGGVDGFIHRAAGADLKRECLTLNGCNTGDAKVTGGYLLPAKYVIHTVGPQNQSHELLLSCYQKCFKLMKENNMTTVAFPCIATGIYGFPNRPAAHIACATARKFLEEDIKSSDGSIRRVIFCTFLQEDYDIYQAVAQLYFPCE